MLLGKQKRGVRSVAITNCIVTVMLALTGVSAGEAQVPRVQIGAGYGTVQTEWGVTHYRHSIDPGRNPEAAASARQLLQDLFHFQNVWIEMVGSNDFEPAPGQLDFRRLDERLALVRATGGVPVITLCCAPDWMRRTDIKDASIDASYFDDYVQAATQVARRYPYVKYYLVWSEMKGFWNRGQRRWDYEGYTELYNLLYDALKHVSNDIRVGGPYVHVGVDYSGRGEGSELRGAYGTVLQPTLDSIEYWLREKHGADFIAVDGGLHGNPSISNGNIYPANWFAATQYYADVDAWLHHQAPGLPIWWAEWYSTPDNHDMSLARFSHDYQNALMTMSLFRMMPDVAVALRWKPEGEASLPYEGDQESVWSDARMAGGGKPFPFAESLKSIAGCFPKGEVLLNARAPVDNVAAYASSRCVALINQTDQPAGPVSIEGKTLQLAPYAVAYVRRH